MDPISNAFAGLMSQLIRSLLGPRATEELWGPITWADLGASVAILCLALLVQIIAAVIVRRTPPPPADAAIPGSWRAHITGAVGVPLYLFIWVCGLYVAAAPLMARFGQTEGVSVARKVFGFAFDLAVGVLLFSIFLRLTHVLNAFLSRHTLAAGGRLPALLLPLVGRCLRIALPVAGVILAIPLLHLPAEYAAVLSKATSIVLIVAVAVVVFQIVAVGEQAILSGYDLTAPDNLRARKVYTQIHVIRNMIDVIVGLLALAFVLMLFDEVRHIGASLLASAGIVGIIAGIAAQKTIGNLIAGCQIALTQPIRLDDVVVVEGEWGRIEEITLTYVVVHIWDDRRLVVPLSYFIEKPFQNWTRTSAGLLGSIIVWVDYSFPVEEGRKALKEIIEGSPGWDGRFWNLQVTDSNERALQLRILATSKDSSSSWDFRCEIREKFFAFVQNQLPLNLPQLRTSRRPDGQGTLAMPSPEAVDP